MKNYSFEVVSTAALAAIFIHPCPAFAQDRAPDPVKESTEAGGDLFVREFSPGRKVVVGGTPIMVFEKYSIIQGKPIVPSSSSQPSPAATKPQTASANAALGAWVQGKLGAKNSRGTNTSVIRIRNGELFKPGSGKLSEKGQKTLGNVAAMINRHASPEVSLVVYAEPNLAKKRANAVRSYLAKSSKISTDQVKVLKSIDGIPAKEARFATNILVLDRRAK